MHGNRRVAATSLLASFSRRRVPIIILFITVLLGLAICTIMFTIGFLSYVISQSNDPNAIANAHGGQSVGVDSLQSFQSPVLPKLSLDFEKLRTRSQDNEKKSKDEKNIDTGEHNPIKTVPVLHGSNPTTSSLESFTDQAYVFFMTNDSPMKMLFALEGSLKERNTTRRRIVMVTPSVSEESIKTLNLMGMETRRISKTSHQNYKILFPRWADTLAKLAFWELTDLKKIIYMDADFMTQENLDYLFDFDTSNGHVWAMSDGDLCVKPTHMNAGLIVATPNVTLKDALMKQLDDPLFFKEKKGDQEMMDVYLSKHKLLHLIPESHVSFIWRCRCIEEKAIEPFDVKHVKAMHFTGWFLNVEVLLKRGSSIRGWDGDCAKMWYERWIFAYRFMESWWNRNYPDIPLKLPVTK